MKFDITDKLKANEDPVLVFAGLEITVKSDAATVLQLMDIMDDAKNNTVKMQKAQELLFTEDDRHKISRLTFYNWIDFMNYAVQLAVNGGLSEDSEDDGASEGELEATPIMT